MASTGKKINYALRPGKNVERKMMCEFIRELKREYDVSKYRYIGFGSFYFSDFIMLHKKFNINNMVSIEKDIVNRERFEFNKPFGCIDICFGDSSDVLNSEVEWDSRTKDIIWLDYDDVLTESKIQDLEMCVKKAISGSLVIISFNATLNDKIEGGRLADLNNNIAMERIPSEIKNKDLDPSESHKVFRNIIKDALDKNLVEKNSMYVEECDKYFMEQIMFFKYRDGATMLTLGFTLIKNSELEKYRKCKLHSIEFYSDSDNPYKIEVPNFTYKELMALNATLPAERIEDVNEQFPFISQKDIEKYNKIYRYFPNFTEIS